MLSFRFLLPIAFALTMAGNARAEEPKGCDGFKWPLKHEADLLQALGKPSLASGATLKVDGQAIDLKLVDFDTAALPVVPERAPKAKPSMAGFVHYESPPAAGAYQITLSQGAWIDIVQDGKFIKPTAFSGATDCPGVRKSVRLTLAGGPFTIQISGTQASSIGIVLAPIPPVP